MDETDHGEAAGSSSEKYLLLINCNSSQNVLLSLATDILAM